MAVMTSAPTSAPTSYSPSVVVSNGQESRPTYSNPYERELSPMRLMRSDSSDTEDDDSFTIDDE